MNGVEGMGLGMGLISVLVLILLVLRTAALQVKKPGPAASTTKPAGPKERGNLPPARAVTRPRVGTKKAP